MTKDDVGEAGGGAKDDEILVLSSSAEIIFFLVSRKISLLKIFVFFTAFNIHKNY